MILSSLNVTLCEIISILRLSAQERLRNSIERILNFKEIIHFNNIIIISIYL